MLYTGHGIVVYDTVYIVQATINNIMYVTIFLTRPALCSSSGHSRDAHKQSVMSAYTLCSSSGHSRDAHKQSVMSAYTLDYILITAERDQKPEGSGDDADPAKDVSEERDDQGEGWVLF